MKKFIVGLCREYLGIFIILLITLGWGMFINYKYFPRIREIERKVEMEAPVMQRILDCESKKQHLNSNGQLNIGINRDGSYDMGKFQINSIWNKQATALGLDLSKESDNEKFAMWLYKNIGTSPWSSSMKCWNK